MLTFSNILSLLLHDMKGSVIESLESANKWKDPLVLMTWEWLENDAIVIDKKTFSSYDGNRGNRDLAFEYDLKERRSTQGSSLNSSKTYCPVCLFF